MMGFYHQVFSIIALLLATTKAVIPPSTDGPATGGLPEGYDSSRFIVTYKNSIGARLAKRTASKVHVNLGRHNALAASFPPDAVEELRSNSNIVDIEEDGVRFMATRHTSSFLRGNQQRQLKAQTVPYGITMVQADQVSLGNDVKKVCVIDSGYRMGHPDLPMDGVDGYDGNLQWDEDNDGHGSHVTGTIAAVNNNEGVIGVVPGVDLFIVRVFGDDGRWAYSSDLVDAFDRCVTAGAKVVNMSLGGDFPERFEKRAFERAFMNDNVLSIAAAGNDGNTRHSYPASYNSVVSVAALDETKTIADFSQRTPQVELAAPGVSVLSTSVGIAVEVEVENESFIADHISLSETGSVTGNLCDCGRALNPCTCSDGDVCLIERGDITFYDKTVNCISGGGAAAIIYNNAPGNFAGTLGESIDDGIPAVSLSQADGQALARDFLGKSTTVYLSSEPESGYFNFDGTSMASPHVAGVAALVWSNFPSCSNCEIRNALIMSAEDLGTPNRDNEYGYGLVQAKAAFDYLGANGCTGAMNLFICRRWTPGEGGGGIPRPNGEGKKERWRQHTQT